MAASSSNVYVDERFWTLVWPQLQAGGWRCVTNSAARTGKTEGTTLPDSAEDGIAAVPGSTKTSDDDATIATAGAVGTNTVVADQLAAISRNNSSEKRCRNSSTSTTSSNSYSSNRGSSHDGGESKSNCGGPTSRDSFTTGQGRTDGGQEQPREDRAAAITSTATPPSSPSTPDNISGATNAENDVPPVFFPPALGLASEALEEAMRRNLPADGSAGDDRLVRVKGIDAVVEILQQVPGYPGTTSFGVSTNMDAVAAAARAVLVRTPPTQAAAARQRERTTVDPAQPSLRGRKAVRSTLSAVFASDDRRRKGSSNGSAGRTDNSSGSPDSNAHGAGGRSGSCSRERPVRNRSRRHESAAPVAAGVAREGQCDGRLSRRVHRSTSPRGSPSSSPSSSSSLASVTRNSRRGTERASARTAAAAVEANFSTRRGRVIKKPVRLEENPGPQTLKGRNGRSDAPEKVAARAAAAQAEAEAEAKAKAIAEAAAAASEAAAARAADSPVEGILRRGARADKRARGAPVVGKKHGLAAVETTPKSSLAGSDRCVARLGTAAGGGNRGVAMSKSSSSSKSSKSRMMPSMPYASNDDDDELMGKAGNGVSWGITGLNVSDSGRGDAGKKSRTNDNVGTGFCQANVGAGIVPGGVVVRTALPAAGRTAGQGANCTGVHDNDKDVKTVGVDGDTRMGAGTGVETSNRRSRHAARMIVPDPAPIRPVKELGEFPDETVKEYKRAFDDVLWPALAEDHGWTKIQGPRTSDAYYFPEGIERGKNGAKCRVDFYDSFKQVILHLVGNEAKYGGVLERAWAVAVAKPRPASRREGGRGGGSKRRRRWTEQSRRKSTMMTNEYPKKVSRVGRAHQVDPLNLCTPVPSEEYIPPEDVIFEQVWSPIVAGSVQGEDAISSDPDDLAEDFRGAISYDKCLEVLFQCKGNENLARTRLKSLVRLYKTRYPEASSAAREVVAAQAIVHRETTARLRAAAAGGGAGTTRRTGSWEGVSVLASRDCTSSSSSPNRGYAGDGGNGSAFWRRPLKALVGGEAALRRQVEGGVSCSPPGVRRRDDLPSTLNLSRPWSEADAETFTQALLEEGSKNFYAVQKALPDRQICELVDRYYGGWKQTEGYKTLKDAISLAKLQAVCWVCQAGGDLICCDGCDAVYHVDCVGLYRVPEGDWFCPTCVKGKKNVDREELIPSSASSSSSSSSSSASASLPVRTTPTTATALNAACSQKPAEWEPPPLATKDSSARSRVVMSASPATGPKRQTDTATTDDAIRSKRVRSTAARRDGEVKVEGGAFLMESKKYRVEVSDACSDVCDENSCGSSGEDASSTESEGGKGWLSKGERSATAQKVLKSSVSASPRGRTGSGGGTPPGGGTGGYAARGLERVPIQLGKALPSKQPRHAPTPAAVIAAAAAAVAATTSAAGGPKDHGGWMGNRSEIDWATSAVSGLGSQGGLSDAVAAVAAAATATIPVTPSPAAAPRTTPSSKLSPSGAKMPNIDVTRRDGEQKMDKALRPIKKVAVPARAASLPHAVSNPTKAGGGAEEGIYGSSSSSSSSSSSRKQEQKATARATKVPARRSHHGAARKPSSPSSALATRGKTAAAAAAAAAATAAAAAAVETSAPSSTGLGFRKVWECRLCLYNNVPDDEQCLLCSAVRPDGVEIIRVAARPPPRVSEPLTSPKDARARAATPPMCTASRRKTAADTSLDGLPSSLWTCRSCSTINKSSRTECLSCGTTKEKKNFEVGKPEWWCCAKCSRFNNRHQDGSTCRICSAPEEEVEMELDFEDNEAFLGGESDHIIPSSSEVVATPGATTLVL